MSQSTLMAFHLQSVPWILMGGVPKGWDSSHWKTQSFETLAFSQLKWFCFGWFYCFSTHPRGWVSTTKGTEGFPAQGQHLSRHRCHQGLSPLNGDSKTTPYKELWKNTSDLKPGSALAQFKPDPAEIFPHGSGNSRFPPSPERSAAHKRAGRAQVVSSEKLELLHFKEICNA